MFQYVIVPLDGSRRAEQAAPVAARLAKCMGAGIVLLSVLEPPGADAASLEPGLVPPSAIAAQHTQDYLDRVAKRMRAAGISTTVLLERGSPAESIIAAAAATPAAIVVMRSRGRTGRLRLGLGSVARKVVASAAAPVFILPQGRRALPPPSPYEPLPQSPLRILVPLDGSPLAEAALGPARELLSALALPGKGEILLLQVIQPFAADSRQEGVAAEAYLQEMAGRLQAELAPDARQTVNWAVVFETEVPLALIQVGLHDVDGQGSGFDLVVMTSHGQGGLERSLLGSVTEQVLYQTHLPVVVVHPRAVEGGASSLADEAAHDPVLLASIESFPASDAPGWVPMRV